MAEKIEWSDKAADHIRNRSIRYPRALDIEPTWTNEAGADPDAVIDEPDPKSAHANSVRIIGYSPTARAVLTVVGRREARGIIRGASAWKASGVDLRRYQEEP
ncbi:MAG: hypothetical protein ACRDQA_27065 [Nocardioidaceae bacterium]